MLRTIAALFLILPVLGLTNRAAEIDPAPKQGAALLKTDIMAVFAHPDDEIGMAATLAYYSLGRTSSVVNVYCTRGEGGGNMVGTQWGAALGILRERELRDCLAELGVHSCFFLDRLDWAYTESVAATLHKWNKEETLEGLVRLVRTFRPEVMVTMNPVPTPGQHGHHQAAAVLATEAFAAAADPNRFPLQLTREGLTVWQPRRLFFGGASETVVSTVAVNERLPDSRTPGQIAGHAMAHHRSQAFGDNANSPWMQRPQKFTLVKAFTSLDGIEHDLLAGLPIPDEKVALNEFAKTPAPSGMDIHFTPRPAFSNYERWLQKEHLQHLAVQLPTDLPLVAGEPNKVSLELQNHDSTSVEGELKLDSPDGWSIAPFNPRVQVGGGAHVTIELHVAPPPGARTNAEIKATFAAGNHLAKSMATLHPLPRTRVPRVSKAPSLHGNEQGWEAIPTLAIGPSDIVQGKVASDADSSATFRLVHDRKTLFVDMQVKDDHVVTNIAPNDIRGHWRSDSVEICLDPAVGAEDTLGCYKIGIFPSDTSGVVRAARDADARQGPIEETAPLTRIFSARTADGYRIQASIPFSEIGLRPNQKRLGFNLIIYDGDKTNAVPGENINKSRIAWSPRSGVQGRPEDWGRIDLE